MKMPTSLERLKDICERTSAETMQDLSEDTLEEITEWLNYTYDNLTQRKLYMKKQQIKKQLAVKLLKEQFSPSEIEEIEHQALQQAEAALGGPDETLSTSEED